MSDNKTEAASDNLDRVLGFFARVENKASFLFAVNTALIAIICLNLQASDVFVWYLKRALAALWRDWFSGYLSRKMGRHPDAGEAVELFDPPGVDPCLCRSKQSRFSAVLGPAPRAAHFLGGVPTI